MGRQPKIKSDKFKKNREGSSRWLLLSCLACKNPIAYYQKDGSGMLKRLYLDRISGVQDHKITAGENLVCNTCKKVLGTAMIYKQENRPAFRLFPGAVEKKLLENEDFE